MKRQDMAQAAEQLLVATAWLPALLRTPPAGQGSAEHEQAEL
jgi:ParB family chromosome partitioning protein